MQGGDVGDLGLHPRRGSSDLHLEVALGVDRPTGHELRQLVGAEAGLGVVEVVPELEQQHLADQPPERGGEGHRAVGGHGQVDAELGALGEDPGEAVEDGADRLVPLGPEGPDPVDEHQDAGLGRAWVAQAPPPVELGAEPRHQPGLALPVGGRDDGPDVRELGQDLQGAGAEVQAVDVEVVG